MYLFKTDRIIEKMMRNSKIEKSIEDKKYNLIFNEEEILEAVSEILLNTIIHGYKKPDEIIHIEGSLEHIEKAYGKYCYYLILIISDTGKGITDTNVVLEDKFTTRKDLNLTGTGLTKCKTLTDSLTVESIVGLGTKVILRKEI